MGSVKRHIHTHSYADDTASGAVRGSVSCSRTQSLREPGIKTSDLPITRQPPEPCAPLPKNIIKPYIGYYPDVCVMQAHSD